MLDDRWKRKGHLHEGKEHEPEVCRACHGFGFIEYPDGTKVDCDECGGEGYVYD